MCMMRRAVFTRVLFWLGALTVVGGSFRPANGASSDALSLTATLELSQVYHPGDWQPVRLEFRNSTDQAIDGAALLPLGDPASPAVMKLAVNVPAHAQVRRTVWGYFPRPVTAENAKKAAKVPPLSIAEWRG